MIIEVVGRIVDILVDEIFNGNAGTIVGHGDIHGILTLIQNLDISGNLVPADKKIAAAIILDIRVHRLVGGGGSLFLSYTV